MYSIMDLLVLTQYQAYCRVKQVINMFPKETVRHKDGSYLVMGVDPDKPKPMLCIHLDTINTHRGVDKPLITAYFDYNPSQKVYSVNPQSNLSCLGGDDRAGLWILLRLLTEKDLRNKYCYGVFFDEEVGGKGSSAYVRDYKDYEDGVSCFIGLDRRGVDEVALYGNDNDELTNVFTKLGYNEAMGTFTDASNLSNIKACCNLSVGYYNEHTPNETLFREGMENTLEVLKKIAREDILHKPEYTAKTTYEDYYDLTGYLGRKPILCDCCGEHLPLYEDDNTGYMLCGDCKDYF